MNSLLWYLTGAEWRYGAYGDGDCYSDGDGDGYGNGYGTWGDGGKYGIGCGASYGLGSDYDDYRANGSVMGEGDANYEYQ